ncbi:UNVERIFIED_ORG: cell wall hydrolase [Roseateles sp. XES5]|nr:cell wall hydrolase [Roseateles sp. XES5]
MLPKFQVNSTGDLGKSTFVFAAPSATSSKLAVLFVALGGYVEQISVDGDWVEINLYRSGAQLAPTAKGWIHRSYLGAPFHMPPEEPVPAISYVFPCAQTEERLKAVDNRVIPAIDLIALGLIEHGLEDGFATVNDETLLAFQSEFDEPSAIGAYGLTETQWQLFLDTGGTALNYDLDDRIYSRNQVDAAAYFLREFWRRMAELKEQNPQEYLPRKVDLLCAWLCGPNLEQGARAALAMASRDEEQSMLSQKMTTFLEETLGWPVNSQETAAFLNRRARFAKTGSNAATVGTFLKRVKEAQDKALAAAVRLLEYYIPTFLDLGSLTAAPWMTPARAQLEMWSKDWVEHRDPGQQKALSFFAATDHGPGKVTNPATGEITDWCGAFTAWCMRETGAPVPKGAALAANWKKWGDVDLPTLHKSEVPAGAVVMLSPTAGTGQIGHVCFFDGWHETRKEFWGLGGNQGDRVTRQTWKSENIVAIRALSDKTVSTNNDLEILARTLWGEIRGGNLTQRRHVAIVVLNRFLTHYRSEGSIASVCRSAKQFSCWNPGTQARHEIDALSNDDKVLGELRKIASAVIAERLAGSVDTFGLTVRHFHKTGTGTDWADPSKFVLNDDAHMFYRDIA